ncbi:uncharacterized protein JN550_012150 [Neoarthrinium moseri]|uniref:uncharacterized protein n=1 Tax=Neoarthrinium moseri TaxID=1658444 RepID=UPI001FDD1C87|nr:uncharacterized protein JN550_012150 [Neoarthrinium moseri]KAI1859230.1 hypothetical protein JN550_012150 [Neoarthrinium moseri]
MQFAGSSKDELYWQNYSNILSCTECGGTKLIQDDHNATIVCESCGLVLMERLAYEDPPPEVLQGDGSLEAYWTYGSALSPELPQQPIGLTEASNEVQLSGQLTPPAQQMSKKVPEDLKAPYRVIQRLCDSWPAPEAAVNLAKKYFQQISKKGVLKNNRSVRATETAVCAFLACRGSSQARTCQELKSLPSIAPNRMGKLIYKLEGLIKKKNDGIQSAWITCNIVDRCGQSVLCSFRGRIALLCRPTSGRNSKTLD